MGRRNALWVGAPTVVFSLHPREFSEMDVSTRLAWMTSNDEFDVKYDIRYTPAKM